MPLSALRPLVTTRFHEVDTLLSYIAKCESPDPLIKDDAAIRIMRGMFFVHLYGAFEYAVDQSFIRLAQHISQRNVCIAHLHKPVCTVVMDPMFTAIGDISMWSKKWKKRLEMIEGMASRARAVLSDVILSPGMQSAGMDVITLAFEIYDIKETPAAKPSAIGYLKDVIDKRHAIAHGRESPATYGVMRSPELRIRYDALYDQAMYVIECVNTYATGKRFISPRYRSRY
jgi:hypothetical protein